MIFASQVSFFTENKTTEIKNVTHLLASVLTKHVFVHLENKIAASAVWTYGNFDNISGNCSALALEF